MKGNNSFSEAIAAMDSGPVMQIVNGSRETCGIHAGDFCAKYEEPPLWTFGIKAFIALVIIAENGVVLAAILKNWKTLMRQHNFYRYVLSLVSADLLNGLVLLAHSVFWIVIVLNPHKNKFQNENFQEVLRNLITGVLHGLTFASLASAALLNLVLRVTSNQALARAAAIHDHHQFCLSGISWVRNPRITVTLIGVMWTLTLTFIIIPLAYHCHMDVCQCFNSSDPVGGYIVKLRSERVLFKDNAGIYDCSILRTPSRRSYLVVLNSCISFAWCFMLVCNVLTICKTEVKKSPAAIAGINNLKLRHRFGMTRDSSSFFAFIITTSLTISTLPFVVFTFITEAGTPYERVYFGREITPAIVEFIELTTYFSSAVNPIIYTAILSRLRSDVSKIVERRKNLGAHKVKGRKVQIKEELIYHERNNGNLL